MNVYVDCVFAGDREAPGTSGGGEQKSYRFYGFPSVKARRTDIVAVPAGWKLFCRELILHWHRSREWAHKFLADGQDV